MRIAGALVRGSGLSPYNISATLPEGGSRAQVPEMLQALLADRFHVKLHKDKDADPEKDEPTGLANVGTIAGVRNGASITFARAPPLPSPTTGLKSVTPEDYQAMNLRSAVVRGFTLPPDAQKFLDDALKTPTPN
jgi:Protein of unknown function (DUF3738)